MKNQSGLILPSYVIKRGKAIMSVREKPFDEGEEYFSKFKS